MTSPSWTFALDCASEIAKNTLMRGPIRRLRALWPRTSGLVPHDDSDLSSHAFAMLECLLQANVQVSGARVLEIGPGDHLSSGLALLAAGARQYVALDRFPAAYSSRSAKAWYAATERAWRARAPGAEWPEWLDVKRFPEGYGDRVQVIRSAIEDAQGAGSFDIVCSHNVGEHVFDLHRFVSAHKHHLAFDRGTAVHRIDFGPHGPWRKYSDPLFFLDITPMLWHLMGSRRGYPNRFRLHHFVDAFRAAGYTVAVSDIVEVASDSGAASASRFTSTPRDSIKTIAATLICTTGRAQTY